MLEDPKFWVAISFVIFALLAYGKLARFTTSALDDRSARIKHELDEAKRLREEAAAILVEYKQKQAEYTSEAEKMLEAAREDAQTLRAQAEKDLASQLEHRTEQALERISQEESQAVAEVREHVVDIALAAARSLIADQVSNMSEDELVNLALTDIERKIH